MYLIWSEEIFKKTTRIVISILAVIYIILMLGLTETIKLPLGNDNKWEELTYEETYNKEVEVEGLDEDYLDDKTEEEIKYEEEEKEDIDEKYNKREEKEEKYYKENIQDYEEAISIELGKLEENLNQVIKKKKGGEWVKSMEDTMQELDRISYQIKTLGVPKEYKELREKYDKVAKGIQGMKEEEPNKWGEVTNKEVKKIKGQLAKIRENIKNAQKELKVIEGNNDLNKTR